MDRYHDRNRYFQELYETSKAYFVNYVSEYKQVEGCRVLEIGCGEGGNLLAFVEAGAVVTGMDLSSNKIRNAITFFRDRGAEGGFFCDNFLNLPSPQEEDRFDIIIIHDVIEHIERPYKRDFFEKMTTFLKKDGVVFWGFPAWQMPFGGHQQICSRKFARFPFVHLLPAGLYKAYLKMLKVENHTIDELLSIKRSRMTVESFRKLCAETGLVVRNMTLWLINPHYKVKFNLRPRKLCGFFSRLPYLRNFLSTSCFFITSF